MLGSWRTNKRIRGGRMRWRQSDQWPLQSVFDKWAINQAGISCKHVPPPHCPRCWLMQWSFLQVFFLPVAQSKEKRGVGEGMWKIKGDRRQCWHTQNRPGYGTYNLQVTTAVIKALVSRVFSLPGYLALCTWLHTFKCPCLPLPVFAVTCKPPPTTPGCIYCRMGKLTSVFRGCTIVGELWLWLIVLP